MQPLRIAVTGVPGSGKTSFCNYIEYDTVSVLDLAKKNKVVIEEDIIVDPIEIDIDLLKKILFEKWKNPPQNSVFVDGHLSHNLPVDCIILMRCRPDILEVRLKERNWNDKKVSENVEFELLSAIINELDEEILTLEIDTTNSTIPQIWDEVNEWMMGDRKTRMLDIDWIKELHY